MHPASAFSISPQRRPGTLGQCKPIVTGVEAYKAAQGDPEALLKTVGHVGMRALLFGFAMMTMEPDRRKLAEQAIGASLAVETFVWGWNALTDGEPLPSGQVACDFCEQKPGSTAAVATTVLVRGLIIAGGISLWGETRPKEVAKKAAASVAALEATILAETLWNR